MFVPPHEWRYCALCETWMVVCLTCGNNACNGTYGELDDGSSCPHCERIYEIQDEGRDEMNKKPAPEGTLSVEEAGDQIWGEIGGASDAGTGAS